MIDINDYIHFLNEEDKYKMLSRYRPGAFIDDENTADSLSYRQAAKNYNKALRKYYSGMNGYDEDGDFIGFNRPFQNTNYVNYHPLDIQENLEEANLQQDTGIQNSSKERKYTFFPDTHITVRPEDKQEFYIGPIPENYQTMTQARACGIGYRDGITYGNYDEVAPYFSEGFNEQKREAEKIRLRNLSKQASVEFPLTYEICKEGGFLSNPATYFVPAPIVGAINGFGYSEADSIDELLFDVALSTATAYAADKLAGMGGKYAKKTYNKIKPFSYLPEKLKNTGSVIFRNVQQVKPVKKIIEFTPQVGHNAMSYTIDDAMQKVYKNSPLYFYK